MYNVIMYVGCINTLRLPRPRALRLKVFCSLEKRGKNKLLNLENSVLVFLSFFSTTETFGPNDCSVKRCGTGS